MHMRVFTTDHLARLSSALPRLVTRSCLSECSFGGVQLLTTDNMEQQQHPKPEAQALKPEVTPDSQRQQQEAGVPPAKPTGTLQDVDPNELLTKRNQILWEQAQRGEQPGLTLMQDALSGENKAQTWGNEPTIMEPEDQN